MELTKTNITKLNEASTSGLEKDVLEYVLDKWDEYDEDDKKAIFTDVLDYGCQSGCVGHLIYYSDTTEYYDNHKDEISELLSNFLWECGVKSPKDLFGDKWDESDPLALDVQNKNLLAWFAFEETMRKIGYEFDEVARYI